MSSEPDTRLDGVAPPDPSGDPDPAVDLAPDRDWTPWLDGRPRRLKRGRDYTGDPKALIRRAREAAEAFDRVAVESRDSQGKYEYVWIQFVHAEIELGRPCPVCGGAAFAKTQKHFMRCERCGAVLMAAEDREVEAGSYALPPPVVEEAPAPEPEEPVESGPDPRASELGDLVGVRVLSRSGVELATASADEPLDFEITLRTHQPGLTAIALCALLAVPAEKKGRVKVLTSGMDRGQELSDPGTYRIRAHVPAHLLSRFEYTLQAGVQLEDPSGAKVMVMDREGVSFSVVLETPEGRPSPGIVHPALAWSVHPGEVTHAAHFASAAPHETPS